MPLAAFGRALRQHIVRSGSGRARPHAGPGTRCVPSSRVLVGTHHKTGTFWLEAIFRDVAARHGLRFFFGEQADLPERWDVFFQNHSRFDPAALPPDPRPVRGVHLIRDPRDVIVSGCFYHQVSDEPWLLEPSPYLGGRSYREAITALDDPGDRLMFELENAGRVTIDEMLAWPYDRPEFHELRYEALARDVELVHFRRLFRFLGFPEAALPGLLADARRHCLFSGRVPRSAHVRSGAAGQWRSHFEARHRRRFLECFGDALVRLGYEADDAWAEAGPPSAGPANIV